VSVLVDLVGLHVETTSGTPLLLLREQPPPHRVLPVFLGAVEAVAIAFALQDQPPPRPMTHDLLATLVDTLHAHVERVEVTEVREGTFVAQLTLMGTDGEHRLDSRPSDAIALALRVEAPVFVSDAVLDESGAIVRTTEEAIEDEVTRFRSFLTDVEPSEFETGPGDGPDL
jgi:bifunctional DNase/RNase